jgi:amino acid adenylation domain-containing protein
MPRSLDDLVTLQAARRPEAVAVAGARDRLTYGRLEERSGRIARMLRQAGCLPGSRVCLLMPKSPGAVAALLGIYKAACIYVPLDPSSPAARLRRILDACEAGFILAGDGAGRVLVELMAEPRLAATVPVGWLGGTPAEGCGFPPRFTAADLEDVPNGPSGRGPAPDDPAHILFTSGSTGAPKGVVITHANVLRFVEWAVRYFGIGPADRISGHPPLHFDLSMLDLFGTFSAGAQLHLVPPDLNLLPNRLAEFIRRAELTQWFSVPSILSYMAKFDVLRRPDFPALRRLLWCGEVFPTASLIYWMRRLPHVTFTNLYGPTETTIASSYYTLPACPEDESTAVPIGTACPGEELLVLDERLAPVPPGATGELYIGGAGLSPGYFRDPDKTRAAFVTDPRGHDPSNRLYRTGDLARRGEDGLVYFLGRSDSQIKSRGYRIELGEIESGLAALESVRECAVVALGTDGFEGTLICCAYVPAGGAGVTPADLRRRLGRALPSHMLPVRWMTLDRLPRNANGKIDRALVRKEFESREAAPARQP